MKYIKGERIWCVSNIQSQVGRPAPVKVVCSLCRLSSIVSRKTNNEQRKTNVNFDF